MVMGVVHCLKMESDKIWNWMLAGKPKAELMYRKNSVNKRLKNEDWQKWMK
jgi:hypothetical protein